MGTSVYGCRLTSTTLWDVRPVELLEAVAAQGLAAADGTPFHVAAGVVEVALACAAVGAAGSVAPRAVVREPSYPRAVLPPKVGRTAAVRHEHPAVAVFAHRPALVLVGRLDGLDEVVEVDLGHGVLLVVWKVTVSGSFRT
jgi:hypothetical protein